MRVAAVLLVLLLPQEKYEGTWNSETVKAQLDWSAILRTWKIKGVLVCTHGSDVTTCLWVENAYPSGLLEVVRQSWQTHFQEGQATLKTLKELGRDTQSSHGRTLQFADVRAWSFVPELDLELDIPLAIPESTLLELDYVSELDQPGWRNDLVDLILKPGSRFAACEKIASPKRCAGRWGSYYPRIGFVARTNEVVSAYLQALRGGRVANDSMGRITLSRYEHEPRTGHYIQELAPKRKFAVPIGSGDITRIERDAMAKHGSMLFAQFGMFETCKRCMPVRLVEERPVP